MNFVHILLTSLQILEPLEIRPPVPPKTPVPPEMMHAQLPPLPPSHPHSNHQLAGMQSTGAISTPQPPPRRKGRFGMRSAAGSPTTGIKSIFDPVGTLKRFMGGMASRPLPAPPKPPPPLPPKPAGKQAHNLLINSYKKYTKQNFKKFLIKAI